jgi:ABC-type phosphate transport system auxiliary subunit
MIHDDISDLLAAPRTGRGAPSLDHIEHTLTSGYANALALEAERLRLERELARLAARLADNVTNEDAAALSALARRLSVADADLARLRGLLVSLRGRADAVRAAA